MSWNQIILEDCPSLKHLHDVVKRDNLYPVVTVDLSPSLYKVSHVFTGIPLPQMLTVKPSHSKILVILQRLRYVSPLQEAPPNALVLHILLLTRKAPHI